MRILRSKAVDQYRAPVIGDVSRCRERQRWRRQGVLGAIGGFVAGHVVSIGVLIKLGGG